MPGLLDKRLVVVTGKGGTGKSTVALALGMLAARRGLRTVVAEVAGQDRAARMFGLTSRPFEEQELGPQLFAISVDPEHALDEYLRTKVGRLADVLTASASFNYFAAATPGMQELVSMGKVWELTQLERRARAAARYDLVILDAPATGHGVAMLHAPRTFADIARVGPVAQQGRAIDATLTDPKSTAVVAVARAEEMPVVETLALRDSLKAELGLELSRVIVNAVLPNRFSARDAGQLGRALEQERRPGPRAALRIALAEHARAEDQRRHLERLEEGTGRAPLMLPFVFSPELSRADVQNLSEHLEEAGK